ncbi:MAG TPA: phosphatidate cytidylyltransferase [Verrucomicrobiota bacterium]|nr:phosphatidate cytidylyltransferase [Verrucomicrobiota bacterium]
MSAEVNAPHPASKARVFVRRLTSTTLLWAAVLIAMFSGNNQVSTLVFAGLISVLAAVGLLEFYHLIEKRGLACFKVTGLIAGITLTLAVALQSTGQFGPATHPGSTNDFELAWLAIFVLGLCVRQLYARANPAGLLAIATTLFGLLYVPWLLNFFQKINFFPGLNGNGKYFLLYFILVTKFSDTGAYAIGSLLGRHKMIPRISPAKTWEGFVGALVVATGASLVYVHFLQDNLPRMTLLHAVILGGILGTTAVLGDLIESIFKREAGVKDSGRFFPGIGGILDLLDSLLFNAPLMYLYMRYVLGLGGPWFSP